MTSMSELAHRLEQVEGKTDHLTVRSELTLYVLSAMIASGLIKKEGIDELIRDAKFNAPGINPAIIEKEKEIVSTCLNKVSLS